MTDLHLIMDLFRGIHRQGPGGDEQTRLAVALSGLKGRRSCAACRPGSATAPCWR